MLKRFEEQRVLVEAILRQPFVCHDRALAEKLGACATLREWSPGERLMQQEGEDRDIFLILSGSVSIEVNGRSVASRSAGQHVGEMALIDPQAKRSASVQAREATVTASISEPDFAKIANTFPFAWRCLASELADRLRQRNRLVRVQNETPLLFFGSSAESLPKLQALQSHFGAPSELKRGRKVSLARQHFRSMIWRTKLIDRTLQLLFLDQMI